MPRLVLIGNFTQPFCSESHYKWTFEQKLGWEVTPIQENKTTTDAIVACARSANALMWVHTHGWEFTGSITQDEMLNRVRALGIPSFSYHLDLYWGLNRLDHREDKIGTHPSWKVDKFYSTDGRPHPWKERGVNHIYLPAGVVEYGCYKGTYWPHLASEVGFVGSEGYHPEYPWRRIMVGSLKNRYGGRFRLYAGMREQALNDAYASIRVVAGDHCFAGVPMYASDRLFETTGRGGFLVYPETRGVTDQIPGLATYRGQDLNDLYTKIDYFLDPARENERLERQKTAQEWVKNNATYTHRLKFILRDLNLPCPE